MAPAAQAPPQRAPPARRPSRGLKPTSLRRGPRGLLGAGGRRRCAVTPSPEVGSREPARCGYPAWGAARSPQAPGPSCQPAEGGAALNLDLTPRYRC